MRLQKLLPLLQELAPLGLAESWDNVGLLIEPAQADVRRILLTIDLTARVLDEALTCDAELILAYHPPIFSGVKRLTQADPQARMLLAAIHRGVAVYSPHTALDAVAGGINDWLVEGLGPGRRRAILPAAAPRANERPDPRVGQGRIVELTRPLGLSPLLARVKRRLSIERLRVAVPDSSRPLRARRIAVVAGAGGAVLDGVEADVFLTGEMRHHDVLAAVERGTVVILTEHTHSERGYLPELARRLRALLRRDAAKEGVRVLVSESDSEPLRWA